MADLAELGIVVRYRDPQNSDKKLKNVGDQAERTSKRTEKSVNRISSAFDMLQSRIKMFASFIAAAFVLQALQRGIGNIIESIRDFDQALFSLQAITGATVREAQVLGESIRDVARKTKFSAQEVAAGVEVLGKAGFDAAESLRMIGPTAQLATGALEDFETVGSLMVTTMRAFQLETVEAGRVADVFANAVTNSKLTIDKLAIAFGYVGAAGKQAGLSLEEVSGTLMILADNGIRASTSGTALRRTLIGLIKPNTSLKEALREVGLTVGEINPKMVGWQRTLKNLAPLMWDFETNTVDMAKAADFFGLRAAQVAAILVRETAEGGALAQAVEKTREIGAAARMAALQQEGLGIKFKNLIDRAKNVALALGDAGLKGVLEDVIDSLRGITTASENFLKAFPEVAQIIGWATSFSVLTVGFYAIGSALKYVIPLAKGFWITMTGPIGIAVTAITGIVTLFSKLKNRMDDVSEAHERQAIAIKSNVDALSSWTKILDRAAEQNLKEYRNSLRRFITDNEDLSESVLDIIDNMDRFSNVSIKSIEQVLAAAGSLDDANKIFQEALGIKQLREAQREVEQWGKSLEIQSKKVRQILEEGSRGFQSWTLPPHIQGEGNKLFRQLRQNAEEEASKIVSSYEDTAIALGRRLADVARWGGEDMAERMLDGLDLTGQFEKEVIAQMKAVMKASSKEGAEAGIEELEKVLGTIPERTQRIINSLPPLKFYEFDKAREDIDKNLAEIREKLYEHKGDMGWTEEQINKIVAKKRNERYKEALADLDEFTEKETEKITDPFKRFNDVTVDFYSKLKSAVSGGDVGQVKELMPFASRELENNIKNTRLRMEEMRMTMDKIRQSGGAVSDENLLRYDSLKQKVKDIREELRNLGDQTDLAKLKEISTGFDAELESIYKKFGEGTPKATREVNDLVESTLILVRALDLTDKQLEKVTNKIKAYAGPEGIGKLNEALKDYASKAQDTWGQTANAVTTSFDKMEDSLVDFIMTGKFQWKDLADTILRELNRIAVRQAILGPISDWASGVDWSGAFSGLFSGIGGGGNTWAGSPGGAGFIGRAAGGPVSSNRTYLVGERGPEIFSPNTSGNIIPNQKNSPPSDQPININLTIQAMDARSFSDMTKRNPDAIKSVIQDALQSGDRSFRNTIRGA